ncbi:hypothetical protein OHA37_38115 [Streptomyces sp. NBC_00335]|uniref:hypothetical protein n=1 Tax=unclassified Streptomyces TaxID=2593676 RepID=UPI0022555135|nr:MULTISPECIES: hypothetical protein [unclassified Streptomyces]MCX5409662.1 hypothetical protein [Streptomyces sp. NBC_00086]
MGDSAHSAAALAHRERLGLPGRPRVAVVVQELVVPERAGVLPPPSAPAPTDDRGRAPH